MTNPTASPSRSDAETVEFIVGEMLSIYAARFTDNNSRRQAIESWARQLRNALLSETTSSDPCRAALANIMARIDADEFIPTEYKEDARIALRSDVASTAKQRPSAPRDADPHYKEGWSDALDAVGIGVDVVCTREDAIDLLRQARHAGDMGYHGGKDSRPQCDNCKLADKIDALLASTSS